MELKSESLPPSGFFIGPLKEDTFSTFIGFLEDLLVMLGLTIE